MSKEREHEEHDQSLNAWRAKLRSSIAADKETAIADRGIRTVQDRSAGVASVSSALRPGASPRSQQPLIAQVTNSWRDDEKALPPPVAAEDTPELRFCDLEDEESCPNLSRDVVRSRRFRKMLAIVLLAFVVFFYAWRRYIHPQLQDEWASTEGFMLGRSNGTYGLARTSDFEGTRIKDLDQGLLPGGPADPEGRRRLVFVGDIHGCKKELTHLLEKVGFNKKTDHLIATGDVVSKGPDNAGVVDELIHSHAESVRGNHEDRLLEAAKTLSSSNLGQQSVTGTSQGYSKDEALLRELKSGHMSYLRDMPLILRIPALPQAHSNRHGSKSEEHITSEILVVHAGLVPHVPLLRQDPYFVMNMRSIDHVTHVPSSLRETKSGKSRPWMGLWNWYNDRVASGRSLKNFHVYSEDEWRDQHQQAPFGTLIGRLWNSVFGGRGNFIKRPKPQTVVYGHDSKMGLQLHRWSKGLDSGCVSGEELTALVLDAKGRMEIISVGCKNYRG